MKRVIIALGVLVLVAGGTITALYQTWSPDEAALRAGGWSDDVAKARAESAASGRPMLVKFGLHG